MKAKHQRLIFIAIGLFCLAGAIGLILNNFNDNLVFYYSPSEIDEGINSDVVIRLGGLVEEGSITKNGNEAIFNITDLNEAVTVKYTGILPPMFREGQGMVARGKMQDGVFVADNLLTKHDEKYMPPEVAESLKKSGKWQGGK